MRDSDPDHALQRASLLAGYAPRAVLVDESVDMLSVAVDAALLDQGLIVLRADGRLDVVATPGPRVDGRGLDVRELALRERTYAAWLAANGFTESASRTGRGRPSSGRFRANH